MNIHPAFLQAIARQGRTVSPSGEPSPRPTRRELRSARERSTRHDDASRPRVARHRIARGLTAVTVAATAVALTPVAADAATVTKQLSINATPIVAATTVAGDTMAVKFQGLAGQVVNVSTSAGTFAANCDATLTVYKPDGVTVVGGPVCGGITGTLTNLAIPANGTYQVVVDPVGTLVGSVKVAVTSASTTQSITSAAPALNVPLAANQTVDLGFSVGTGKFVTVKVTGGNYAAACNVNLTLLAPNAAPLASPVCVGNGTVGIDAAPTTTAGIAKLRLASSVATAGSVKVQVWVGTHVTAPIVVDGAAVVAKLGTPGQRNRYTFSGTTGQAITVNLTASTIATYYVKLVRPDGTALHSQSFGTADAFIDAKTLDATGTWAIEIDPTSFSTGSVTVKAANVANGNGSITIDGPAKTASVTTAGQNVEWTFSATTGQRVATTLTNSTIASGYVTFYRPDGSQLTYRSFGNTDVFYDPIVLDATGTWKLVVDPTGTYTGNATFALKSVTDLTGTVTVGTAKTTTIAQAGQRARYTFAGTSGQRLSLTVTGSTIASGYVTFYRPDGSQLTYRSISAADAFFDPTALDATGTWTIEIDPTSTYTGNITTKLDSVTDQTGAITVGGAAVNVNIDKAGKRARFTFTATAGVPVTTTLGATAMASGYVTLYNPTGSSFTYRSFGTAGVSFSATPNVSGTWTVEVDPTGTATGTASLRLA